MYRTSVDGGILKYTRNLFERKKPRYIYDTITRNICTLLQADAAVLFIYEEDSDKLLPVSIYNLPKAYQDHAGEDAKIAHNACKRRKLQFIRDAKKIYVKAARTGHQRGGKKRTASIVSFPMIIDDNTVGAINVHYSSPVTTLKMEEAASLFVKMAALAIVHTRTSAELHEKTKVLKGVREIAELTSSSHTTDDMIQSLLKRITNTSRANSVRLILIDEENSTAVGAFEYQKDSARMKRYTSPSPLEEWLSDKVLKRRKPVIVSDTDEYFEANQMIGEKGQASVSSIPLMSQRKIVGIIHLYSGKKEFFKKADIERLSLFAIQGAMLVENIMLNKKVKREAKETALLYEISQSLISTLDFDQLLQNILQRLKETFNFLNVSVLLIDEEKQALYTHASLVYSREDRELRMRIGEDGITGHVGKTKRMYYCPDVMKDNYYIVGIENTRSEVCFPLLIGERLIGVLDVESSEIDGFSQDVILLLSSLSAQIAIAIDNAQLYAETKKLSLTDPLTALSNRRSFELFVDAEIRRAERYRRTFVVMMIDFDNFKNYNDKYGHMAGDIVLQKLSKIMKEIIRDVDFLCRYGGDEFVAIFPETDASFALDVAERMRKKIASQKIQPRITLSIGIASFPHDAREKSRLIDLADQACYEAKQRGGNRVIFTFKPKENR
jgi:diguanylate cyclase (GGDEF)-like protein